MDFAEQVESVAYVLCGEGTINFDKFRHIWHAKGVRFIQKKKEEFKLYEMNFLIKMFEINCALLQTNPTRASNKS